MFCLLQVHATAMSHDVICGKWIVCKSDCFYRSVAEQFLSENYSKNIVTLRSYRYSCGMDVPIIIKLELVIVIGVNSPWKNLSQKS